jgi:hypothetical protein
MPITRQESLKVCEELIKLSDQLAVETMDYFSNNKFSLGLAAKVLLGFNIREHLRGIYALMNARLDSQAYVIFRGLYENYVNLEFLCKTTVRNGKRLSPNQKGFLFLSFPIYMGGQKGTISNSDKTYRRIEARRKKLVNSNKYWHGSNLKDIGNELDKLRRKGDTPFLTGYSLFSDLSFATHPNSKDNIFYDYDDKTDKFFLRPPYEHNETAVISSFYAVRSFRKWAVAIRSPVLNSLDEFAKKGREIAKLL